MKKSFETIYCKGNISSNDTDIIIEGEITDKITSEFVSFLAAAPAQYMTNFSGSGLPWATRQQAFFNTPNKGSVKLNGNKFSFGLNRPNSFYSDFNTIKFPYVQIVYNSDKIVIIDLHNEKIAHRSLQYPLLRNIEKVDFYNRQQPIRSQERVLRDSGYDDRTESKDFWGLKPPI
ncbi:hypothetical protein QKU58_gp117 [Pyramimonas orientalis virus]|uniref:Uncharacterized protein n=1 Tax=Pyramimonas orientalis virus 01B TaxID=3134525 RepID=A0A7M3UNG1_9VIRU|nr:hypothetical protein QKU58_gp117 [Pyramimonas orientalis virus]QOI90214.1 hypothetical protein HWQ62_00077 [Pyramimonas orientalis virus]